MAHDGHHHGPHDHHHHPHAPIGHNGAAAATAMADAAPAGRRTGPRAGAGGARSRPGRSSPSSRPSRAPPTPPASCGWPACPSSGGTRDGETLSLLRVEANQTTDVGSITPHLGGDGYRYDPLPAAMTSRRQTLAFVYAGKAGTVRLSLAEARALEDLTPPR